MKKIRSDSAARTMTFNDKAQILDLYYIDMKSSRDIEAITGVVHTTAQNILRRHGHGLRDAKSALAISNSAHKAERNARICAMRLEGTKQAAIAAEVGVSEVTVRTVLRAAGITTKVVIVRGGVS